MMVLTTTKLKEVIIINGCIEVIVVTIVGSIIKLAIQAPPAIPIYRKELHKPED